MERIHIMQGLNSHEENLGLLNKMGNHCILSKRIYMILLFKKWILDAMLEMAQTVVRVEAFLVRVCKGRAFGIPHKPPEERW